MQDLSRLTEAGTPVLVLWNSYFEPAGGHYSVVSAVTNDAVEIMDPQFGEIKNIPLRKFEENWFDDDPRTGRRIMGWHLYLA